MGNAIWGGIWLKDLLDEAGIENSAAHVSFEGFDKPLGSAGIKFIRSIPLEKANESTLLAYEMNGQPLPLAHGYPIRALALGWTGANCVKWLHKITRFDRPQEGIFMDRVYRTFQKGVRGQVSGHPGRSASEKNLRGGQIYSGNRPGQHLRSHVGLRTGCIRGAQGRRSSGPVYP